MTQISRLSKPLSFNVLIIYIFFELTFTTCVFGKSSGNAQYLTPPPGTISVFSSDTSEDILTVPIQTQRSVYKLGKKLLNKVEGSIVAYPENGCQKVSPLPEVESVSSAWILLVNNLDCSFATKAEKASEAGFVAVILYNWGNKTEIFGVESKSKDDLVIDLPIPVYSVGYYDGLLLKDEYNFEKGFYVQIYTPLTLYQTIMAAVIWTGFSGIILVFAYAVLKQCIHDKIRPCIQRVCDFANGISLKRSVNAIPLLEWRPAISDRFETCIFCLEDFIEGDQIRVLDCSHGFHKSCIDTWLLSSQRFCPLCMTICCETSKSKSKNQEFPEAAEQVG